MPTTFSCRRHALMVFAAALTLAPSSVLASDAAVDAHRELEIAALKLRLYELTEYPGQIRKLDSAIKLTRAEVEGWERLEREYRSLRKFDRGSALPLTIEQVRLDLLAAELRLDDLKAQRLAAQRAHQLKQRLLRLSVEQAAARVKAAKRP
ncbi:MAG: hypothetical protein AAF589_00615 [Planctomycetota bacterium]